MTDVLVAGGGPIGLAVAWRCARRGLAVTVVDDGSAGAWQAAAGMLAPVAEAGYGEEPLLRLGLASLRLFPRFVADLRDATGIEVPLRTAGTLQVGFDADDMRALDDLHRFHRELELPAERLTPGQARRREPALTPRLRGALHVPADHSVDARALRAALRTAALDAGVRIETGRVTALAVEGGRAAGLRLSGGTSLRGGTVVLALGAGSGTLPGLPPLPVRPVKGLVLRLRGAADLLGGTVRALVRGNSVYLVPLPGGEIVVGATVEEKGFDPAVAAGAVYQLLRDAIEVVPAVTELELTETVVRFRPGTPDNAPLLGPGHLPGLVLATGHYRNGILLTPVTADAIAALLADGALPAVAAGFGPDRFPAPRPEGTTR
ncbi:glycine oxidase ThiO [Plantactinospora siamensis]|uniref:glycine oxidase n=1 Tax=Plantactinospora siamensis TaxID=555372 RepID=A0ABV6P473_9ACTN